LVGAKAVSVKNILLCLPVAGRELLMSNVGMHGWDGCPWTDDIFASKKILPNFMPRGPNKGFMV
jgi:hypothetical protein